MRRLAVAALLLLASCSKQEPMSAAPSASSNDLSPPPPAPLATAPAAPAESRGSTPSPEPTDKRIAVHASTRYACGGSEQREEIAAAPEPRGARITILGQGPCPGEVRDFRATRSDRRIDIEANYGDPKRCRCVGSGELSLRGLEPGAYDVHVNGGFDRPIAAHVVVPE